MNKKLVLVSSLVLITVTVGGVTAAYVTQSRPAPSTETSSSKQAPTVPTNNELTTEEDISGSQKLSRNVQRKNDISRAMTGIYNYQANNHGQLPVDFTAFRDEYLLAEPGEFKDPSTEEVYGFIKNTESSPNWSNKADRGRIFVGVGYECAGSDETIVKSSSSRSVAFRLALEDTGSYCVD